MSIISSRMPPYVEKTKSVIREGGWGWVIVTSGMIINGITSGSGCLFAIMYLDFLNEFGATNSATSWVGGFSVAMPLVTGPLCSALVDKYGCRTMTIVGGVICTIGFVLSTYVNTIELMYLTFGIITGLGRGLCLVTVMASITFWFEKNRSLAIGLSTSGAGFGIIIFAPLTTYLVSEYGWRGAVLILAGFYANLCVSGSLMVDPGWVKEQKKTKRKLNKLKRKTGQENSEEINRLFQNEEGTQVTSSQNVGICEMRALSTKTNQKKWYATDLFRKLKSVSLFLDLHFLLLSLTILFTGAWSLVPYFYLPNHMTMNGYTEQDVSLAFSSVGVSTIIGMIVLGWLGDRINAAKLLGVTLILCGMSIWGIIIFTQNYILLLGCNALFGFFFSSCYSLSPTILAKLVSLDDFTMAYGLIMLCEGIGRLAGPPLAGFITDLSKTWHHAFYQAGFWMIVSGILVGIIPYTRNRNLCGSGGLKSGRNQKSYLTDI